ncbi:MAG: hypothetical protein GXO75_15095 [Calditrichaeota bacterium]|nr:hypothetical protein [Calditrichota bacterium]
MKKVLLAVLIVAAIALFYFSLTGFAPKADEKHPEVDFSVGCVECHSEVTPEATAEWQHSKHGKFKVGCFVCHGDGEVNFKSKPDDESCISCHSDYEVDWSKSKEKSCFDCHKGHTLKFHQERS